MRSQRPRGLGVCWTACLAAAAALHVLLGGAAAAHQSSFPQVDTPKDLAIVVHKSNQVDHVSRAELRRIFLLETQTWPHGRKITVVLREKGQPERAEAISVICGMREPDFEKYMLFQTFRGSVTGGHRTIRSAAAMLRFVFNAPGAIGYVYADEVDDSTKVLRVDGLLPGEPGYSLHRAARRTERKSAGM